MHRDRQSNADFSNPSSFRDDNRQNWRDDRDQDVTLALTLPRGNWRLNMPVLRSLGIRPVSGPMSAFSIMFKKPNVSLIRDTTPIPFS